MELECDFDLEGNGLYSVKWYKDKREFYRYVPQELPMVKHFPSPGIKLNVSGLKLFQKLVTRTTYTNINQF